MLGLFGYVTAAGSLWVRCSEAILAGPHWVVEVQYRSAWGFISANGTCARATWLVDYSSRLILGHHLYRGNHRATALDASLCTSASGGTVHEGKVKRSVSRLTSVVNGRC